MDTTYANLLSAQSFWKKMASAERLLCNGTNIFVTTTDFRRVLTQDDEVMLVGSCVPQHFKDSAKAEAARTRVSGEFGDYDGISFTTVRATDLFDMLARKAAEAIDAANMAAALAAAREDA